MRKHNEQNERMKRRYITYLKQAKGKDEKTIDKALAALVLFEESTRFKPFKGFHIEQAGRFKEHLAKAKNARTGKPLTHATVDATLRMVKAFFHWLAGQPGYKSVLSYPDVEYFNKTAKNARIAHTQRDVLFPSIQQALHAFQAMPNGSDIEKRNKALFAFFMLTGARDGAVASLKLKHVNLADGHILQDGRDVNTKNGKTIDTWFYPVDPAYRECFEAWVRYLQDDKLFGREDALFPKPEIKVVGGRFQTVGLSRQNYSGASKLIHIIREAFAMVQLPEYTSHSFRKTLGLYANRVCEKPEEFKAWSLNLGHEHMAITFNAYMPVDRTRHRELIQGMKR